MQVNGDRVQQRWRYSKPLLWQAGHAGGPGGQEERRLQQVER